jgi:hypothetical protein
MDDWCIGSCPVTQIFGRRRGIDWEVDSSSLDCSNPKNRECHNGLSPVPSALSVWSVPGMSWVSTCLDWKQHGEAALHYLLYLPGDIP